MKKKFKVGDKVRWTGNDPVEGVIQKPCRTFKGCWVLKLKDGDASTYNSCAENNLKHIK